FPEALAFFRGQKDDLAGIGFVFGAEAGFTGVDLDRCLSPESSAVAPWAKDILGQLNSYAEISPSGTGVKVFAQGSLPGAGRHGRGLEMYDRGRFFTVTGQHLAGTPRSVEARQEQLAATYRQWFGDEPVLPVEAPQPATQQPPLRVIGADAELIRRA